MVKVTNIVRIGHNHYKFYCSIFISLFNQANLVELDGNRGRSRYELNIHSELIPVMVSTVDASNWKRMLVIGLIQNLCAVVWSPLLRAVG